MTHPIAFPPPSTVPELALAKEVRAMFLGGEQGAWYDPSDRATLFQDAAGTTPVTAVEQPVGLVLDKSRGLVLGSELVTNGDFSSGAAGWVPRSGKATQAVVGGEIEVTAIASDAQVSEQSFSVVPGRFYLVTGTMRASATNTVARSCRISINGSTAFTLREVSANGVQTPFSIYAIASASTFQVQLSVASNGAWGAVGDKAYFDNISVRELPGNHAFQTTAASRPVLSARVNLLTKTEQFDDVVWNKARSRVAAGFLGPRGRLSAYKLIEDATASNNHYVGSSGIFRISAGSSMVFSISAKAGERTRIQIHGFGYAQSEALFDLISGQVVQANAAVASVSCISEGDGWYRLSVRFVPPAADHVVIVALVNGISSSYSGDNISGAYIDGADLRVANTGVNLPPYQRVNTATDYDTAGFPMYLRFDGVDDFLQTNSINFTGTDKMTVFAGVRKLSDAALAAFCELSTAVDSNNGSFVLYAPVSNSATYSFGNKGTTTRLLASSPVSFASPITNVLSAIADISGDQAILRINGTQAASNTTDQGTGTYGNYPLYIGRRAGTSLPFNGHLYQLIVRGAQSSLPQVQAGEKWTNNRTGAY